MKIDISYEDYQIKDLYLTDLTKILNWLKVSDEGHFVKNKDEITIDSLKKEYSTLINSPMGFFIGMYKKASNNLVGYISGEVLHNKKTLFISMLMIDKVKRKRYLGTKLTKTLIEYIKTEYKIKQVFVSVDRLNAIGIKFWRSLGFAIYSSKILDSESLKDSREILILNKNI